MKGSDYIVDFLVKQGITDVFGYPGATVCHLMDSLEKSPSIQNHLNYHEQACAFAACGYAQSTGKVGVAYANGGPGFTNLITGITNAFYDSIPTVFICGQVDTTDMVGSRKIRQNGIQEIPISKIAQPFTKKAILVCNPEMLQEAMTDAFKTAVTGRPGPVVIEIPANIQRADIGIKDEAESLINPQKLYKYEIISKLISGAKRPVILAGNGIKVSGLKNEFKNMVGNLKIPVLMTLPSFDLLGFDNQYNYGFIGNNGFRYSNYILEKSDLIIALGSRLDGKQVGKNADNFTHGAKLVRVDVDSNELSEKICEDEIQINANVRDVIEYLSDLKITFSNHDWLSVCQTIKKQLYGYDFKRYHYLLQRLFSKANENACFTADVGHHEVYLAQALQLTEEQTAIMSLGLATMGYSLPAAIGAYYGKHTQIVSLSGDGGIQMNIQELQMLVRDNLPVKVIVFNNSALGMVREFQERNFHNICCQTTKEYGYTVPDFEKIAFAYGLRFTRIEECDDKAIDAFKFSENGPELIELVISEPTYLYPRYARGKRICDMDPDLETNLKNKIEVL